MLTIKYPEKNDICQGKNLYIRLICKNLMTIGRFGYIIEIEFSSKE
jgi:hypothetical protein